tara:strand:- start:453 stop:575 length:123 start_codon:yes stop_codon:yes gene_type:complete
MDSPVLDGSARRDTSHPQPEKRMEVIGKMRRKFFIRITGY